jgi:NADPH:quinone reductase-like Zn-dependent oxidoreductase
VIIDAVAKRSFGECRHALTPKGMYVTTAFSPGLFLQQQWVSLAGGQRMAALVPKEPDYHIRIQLEALLEDGKLTPVVGRCYPLHEVADALRFYETGHTQGRVVITM